MLKKTGFFYNLCKHIGLFQRKKNPAVTAHVIHLGFCLLVMNIQCVLFAAEVLLVVLCSWECSRARRGRLHRDCLLATELPEDRQMSSLLRGTEQCSEGRNIWHSQVEWRRKMQWAEILSVLWKSWDFVCRLEPSSRSDRRLGSSLEQAEQWLRCSVNHLEMIRLEEGMER